MPLNLPKVKWGTPARDGSARAAPAPRRVTAGPDEAFASWVLSPPAVLPKVSTRPGLQAVLFDLDGVLVHTAEFHFQAWNALASDLGLPFDRHLNESFRGVGRMDCLEKLLGPHARFFAPEEKAVLADRKNALYLDQVRTLTPAHVATGTRELLAQLRTLSDGGARLAVVSASRNARHVLGLLKLAASFDVIIDGNDVTRSKPDPQGFLLAAERLRVRPDRCVVIEDAEAGIKAAYAAGMKCVGVAGAPGDLALREIAELSAVMLERVADQPGEPVSS